MADNSEIRYSAALVKKLATSSWPANIPATTLELIDRLLAGYNISDYQRWKLAKKLEILSRYLSPFMNKVIRAMTENTLAVTMWRGGRLYTEEKKEAGIFVDCRLLPGITRAMISAKMAEVCQGFPVAYQILNFNPGYQSSPDSGLLKIFRKRIREEIPKAEVIPFIASGGSDGRYLINYGVGVYGFSPVLPDQTFEEIMPLVHGVNERITVASLLFGTKVLYKAVLDYCGKENKYRRNLAKPMIIPTIPKY